MDIPLRVLVVDDEPRNARIVSEILAESCTLATATDGAAALALLASFKPDVMILDVMMPGANGLDICRQLKADPVYAKIKVILASGRASNGDRGSGLAAGADAYITKPFADDELLQVLEQVTGRRLS